MQLTIPDKLAAEIEREAKLRNLAPDEVVMAALRTRFETNGSTDNTKPRTNEKNGIDEDEQAQPNTLGEALSEYIGSVSSKDRFPDGSRMSEDCGKTFAEALYQRHRRQQ